MFYQRIRYFLKAAEAGSFSRAAEQLFLSPQALTKQINLLEEEIGGRLFTRSRRGAALTPLGEYAQAQFSRIDRDLAHVMQELKRQAGTQKKQIRIGIFSSLPQDDLVSPVLSFLLSRYPEYAISLEMLGLRECRDSLLDGKMDLLLTYIHKEEAWKGYVCSCFAEHDAKVVVSLIHPWAIRKAITVQDLEEETFLKMRAGEGNYIPPRGERFYDKIPCREVVEIANFETLLALLHQGKGFAVFPDVFADVERSRVKAFAYPGKTLPFYTALVSRWEDSDPWIRQITEDIREEFNLKSREDFS